MPKKTPAKLTVQTATRQARKHVDALMPGVMATVETRGSADPTTLEHLMVTTVTFPHQHVNRLSLQVALGNLSDVVKVESYPSRVVVKRTA